MSQELVKETRRPKIAYTPREKYLIACGSLDRKSHIQIAEQLDKRPLEIYQALRSDWVKILRYAISRERGNDETDAEMRYGGW